MMSLMVMFLTSQALGKSVQKRGLDTAEDFYMDLAQGQRDVMAILDDLVAKTEPFLTSFSGGITLGSMIGVGCIAIGVSLMCCWLSRQWDDILANVTRMLSRNAPAAPVMTNTVNFTTVTDSPPAYEMVSLELDQVTEIPAQGM